MIPGQTEAVYSAFLRLHYGQSPESEDGYLILETVRPVEDELPAQKHARSVLYDWLWGLQSASDTTESNGNYNT